MLYRHYNEVCPDTVHTQTLVYVISVATHSVFL